MDEQSTIEREALTEQRLAQLARFESLFANENIIQGFNIWIRSSAPMLVINLAAALLGVAQSLGLIFQYLSIALNFYLLHLAAAHEARRRWSIEVLPSTWWSIYWRVLVYVLPLSIALVLMMPIDLTAGEDAMAQYAGPLMIAGLIVLVISIIPTGLAASSAFLLAVRRRRLLRELGLRFSGPSREEERGEEQDDRREDS